MKLKIASAIVGSLVAISVPISIGVVGRNTNDLITYYKILPTYTGQADQLIGLGIKPDYYPLQLDQTKPFSYILDPAKYMIGQSKNFKEKFARKIKELVPNTIGTSWWNQQAILDGEKGSDPEYWTHIGGDLIFFEHYLLDDGEKQIDNAMAPKHIKNKYTFIETNFRMSRDPYTRLPKNIIEGLLDQQAYDKNSLASKQIINKLLGVARAIEGEVTDLRKAVDGEPLPSGVPTRSATEDESWLYNDYIFARQWHTEYMDNTQFTSTSFNDWVINKNGAKTQWVFDLNPIADLDIAKLFFAGTYQPSEIEIKNYAEAIYRIRKLRHHPIYEQQEEIGGAPMFEGAQRDNMLYLYDLASKLQNSVVDTNKNRGAIFLRRKFKNDIRLVKMKHALINANKISSQLRIRMANIKKIVDILNNPSFAITTLAPGAGQTTIQTSSKYSFLYRELGFKQPLPKNLHKLAQNPLNNIPSKANKNSFFNMDDNGWWWNLGTGSNIIGNVAKFGKNSIDIGVFTANNIQYNLLKKDQKQAIEGMYKNVDNLENIKVDYNLWNEGLKTPFVMNMILDYIVNELKKFDKTSKVSELQFEKSNVWGDYWTNEFVKLGHNNENN